ncbi:uncharacterized protein LY89DRAFT_41899 [Mollisia scopiformis]|uniref:Uncharacterized protein n=1 Tax=Mollisia scopiformis TaxID=149040 RepID=A0A194XDJ0_MOLSC|nr:uncharacterized protein LY89DRAFT_41899 [Mollisia scopiformis]KUJ18216.1 hypothetical protein LY89DRAFT_41899 [Mollisia scopiformis]
MQASNMIRPPKRKASPGTDGRLPKQQALSKRTSTTLSSSPLSLRTPIALANRQISGRSSPGIVMPTYGATSATSSFASSLPYFNYPLQASNGINSLAYDSHLDYNASVSASQRVNSTDQMFHLDPSLSALDAPYGGTLSTVSRHLQQGNVHAHSHQFDPPVQASALQHLEVNVVKPELDNDSATTSSAGWTDRMQVMAKPALLQNEEPSYSAESSVVDPPHTRAAQMTASQAPNDSPDFPSECFLCPQPLDAAQAPVFATLNDYNVHLWQKHMDLSTWKEQRCSWEGCSTKCTFATPNLWFAHVRQVHQKNFWCTHPGCKFRRGGLEPKPFGSQHSLHRHSLSKSHAPPLYCDKPYCTGHDNIARSDKRNKHNTEYHGPILCRVDGCPRGRYLNGVYYGFATHQDLVAHHRLKHTDTALDYGTTTA